MDTLATPAADPAVRAALPDTLAGWRALPAVALDCGWLLTLTDLTSDQRLLLRYDAAGALARVTPARGAVRAGGGAARRRDAAGRAAPGPWSWSGMHGAGTGNPTDRCLITKGPHHMRHLRLAASLFGLLLLVEAAPAQGQITASLAAVHANLAVEKKAGCWGCANTFPVSICIGGQAPGTGTASRRCSADAPVEPRVWRGGPCCPGCRWRHPVRLPQPGPAVTTGLSADRPEYRNCEGILVARWQDGMQVANVRSRTATLTL
ncbi:MAG: hypothetical protein IPJ95_04420 [Gemmatimonadetes bacterium]|nr:hypothetical protein [Gemmatimonadota bacterium]